MNTAGGDQCVPFVSHPWPWRLPAQRRLELQARSWRCASLVSQGETKRNNLNPRRQSVMRTNLTESPRVVSQAEWLSARRELLIKEKQLTRQRDEIDRQRR